MINISKEDFCKCIDVIEKYKNAELEVSDVISKYGDGYFIFNPGWNVVYSLIKTLGILTNSPETEDYGNDIDYYLFESCKQVWIGETKYDISTPEKLYEYLIIQDKKLSEESTE